MKKSIYEPYLSTIGKQRKKKLTVKLKRQKVIIDYTANVLNTDYGCFNFDDITFAYSNYNLFQMVKLWKKGEVIATLFFDEKDTFKVMYEDEFAFFNFNINLMFNSKIQKIERG